MKILSHTLISLAALTAATIATGSATRPAMAQETAPAAPKTAATTIDAHPALWMVKDADTTIYLFGTVHVLPAGLSWFKGAVKTAFDSAGTILLETDMRDRKGVMQAMMAHGYASDDQPFTARMTAADKARYVAALAKLGMPATAFDMLKPWAAAATLSALAQRKAGYDLASGVDVTLADAAKQENKTIDQFESVDTEFGYFDALPEKVQIAYLNATTTGSDTSAEAMAEMMNKLVAEWRTGKPDALGATLNADMGSIPEMADVLIYQRNESIAKRIKALLDTPGTVFASMGAGHLGGPRNVRDDLAALGVSATRVAD